MSWFLSKTIGYIRPRFPHTKVANFTKLLKRWEILVGSESEEMSGRYLTIAVAALRISFLKPAAHVSR